MCLCICLIYGIQQVDKEKIERLAALKQTRDHKVLEMWVNFRIATYPSVLQTSTSQATTNKLEKVKISGHSVRQPPH